MNFLSIFGALALGVFSSDYLHNSVINSE
jgi:hypothetical protein